MQTDNYIMKSLELHLFFGRIMKEHSFFLRAGFTPACEEFSEEAETYKRGFEQLMCQALNLSGGFISRQVLTSGELITEFTANAERQTECLTGISIDKDITTRQMRLSSNFTPYNNRRQCYNLMERRQQVQRLNQTALELLSGLICFKERILQKVLQCEMFTMNYPLLIEHILREARLYREYIEMLERDGRLSDRSMKEVECFWNQIMMEHAMFIRGLLDPTEEELFYAADGYAKDYAALLEQCRCAEEQAMPSGTLEKTMQFRDFKMTGTQGITQCKIRSVILPLLADHVLREANHYLRLLKY